MLVFARPPRPPSGPLGLLMLSLADVPQDEAERRLARARELLQQAIEKARGEGKIPADVPVAPRDSQALAPIAGEGKTRTPGLRVDKYFGARLPPVCAQLGCYVTDDGKRFYCVNPACQKHKIRETKHTRRGRSAKPRFAYFHCPKCESRSIEMHVLSNSYICRACKYSWKR